MQHWIPKSGPAARAGAPHGWTRRQWLKIAGAAAAGLPAFTRLAYAQKAVQPLRLICWPLQNGAESNYFFPNGSNTQLSTITEPLRKYADITTFLRGTGISGSVNHYAIRSTYTGANVATYTSPNPTVKSIDQIVADHIAATSPMPVKSLHLGVIPADSLNAYQRGQSMSFFAPQPVDYEANPVTAYDKLWAGGAAPTPMPVGTDYTDELLNVVEAEMDELTGRLGGAQSEVAKLTQHRDAVKGLRPTGKPGGAQMPMGAGGTLASVEKLRPALQGNAKDAYKRDYFVDLFDAQIDIIGRALTQGLTRVVTLQCGSADNNLLVPVDGKGYPHHNTSHGNQALFSKVQAFYFTKMARLLDLLNVADPLDPGRTVLDNTVILMIAECLPVAHSSGNVPVLLVGKLGGKIKPGIYQGGTNKNVNATILKCFGLDGAQFGSNLVSGVMA
jgi:Protein of unknown function (DUF1552)